MLPFSIGHDDSNKYKSDHSKIPSNQFIIKWFVQEDLNEYFHYYMISWCVTCLYESLCIIYYIRSFLLPTTGEKGPTVIWLTIYLNMCYWINTPQTTCVCCHCYGLSRKYNYVNIICNYLSTLVSEQDVHVRWCSYLFTVTPRVSLVEQERTNIWKYMSSFPLCSGIRVDQYLVFCVVFIDHCLSFSSVHLAIAFLRLQTTPLITSNFY
jgi:hypothetical protein